MWWRRVFVAAASTAVVILVVAVTSCDNHQGKYIEASTGLSFPSDAQWVYKDDDDWAGDGRMFHIYELSPGRIWINEEQCLDLGMKHGFFEDMAFTNSRIAMHSNFEEPFCFISRRIEPKNRNIEIVSMQQNRLYYYYYWD